MKVMVVGGGGREHAIVWKLTRDDSVTGIVCCPGNAGIEKLAKCVPVEPTDVVGLLSVARSELSDMVLFGPEEPLVRGAADFLRGNGLTVFGPSEQGSRLEGSKVFAKLFMRRHAIPSAGFEVFDDYKEANKHLSRLRGRVVVKADGLAKGKGAVVCEDAEAAQAALKAMMVERQFGESGSRVIVEECLEGEEVSVMAVCDGREYVLLPVSQDHKRAQDGDRGPNTGGMGAYSPVPFVGDKLLDSIESTVIRPTIDGMAEDGAPFSGILYAGLMLTSAGPKVLEFNCRLGDPEAQAVLPSAGIELGETFLSAARGELPRTERAGAQCHSACVILASGGYPGEYETGLDITGLDTLEAGGNVLVFHAGTRKRDGRIVTAGGRVLGVTGTGAALDEALARAYAAIRCIQFKGMHYRRDIGARALRVSH